MCLVQSEVKDIVYREERSVVERRAEAKGIVKGTEE